MNARLRQIATAAFILTVTTGPVAAQRVSHDYDKSADFSQLRTFAFRQGTSSGNPLVDERITDAIAASLAARGMTRDDSRPDLYIVTHLTFDKEKDITAYSTGPGYGAYGWYWGGGWGTTDVRVRDILMGTLIIDMIDAKKKELIWRGIGVKEVKQHRKPESIDKNVNEAVTKILKEFPPKRST